MIDADQLTPAERALYTALSPNGIAPNVKAQGARVSSLTAIAKTRAACLPRGSPP